MRVEQLVVAQLVGRDLLADGLEHRLLGRRAQRAVVGGGAHLDDAARDQLARARAADRLARVHVRPEAGDEAPENRIEAEAGIGHLGPLAERLTVLDLLGGPGLRRLLELGIVGEDVAEIGGVVVGVVLDARRRLDDLEQLRVDLAGIEPVPRDVLERPVLGRLLRHGCWPPSGLTWTRCSKAPAYVGATPPSCKATVARPPRPGPTVSRRPPSASPRRRRGDARPRRAACRSRHRRDPRGRP